MILKNENIVTWEMLPEERKFLEWTNEHRTYGMWWYPSAFLLAAADLVYILQDDGSMTLNTKSQNYTSWIWISFEEYTVQKLKDIENTHAMETERRNQQHDVWTHRDDR